MLIQQPKTIGSTDIAAPGVNTLSTAGTHQCSLCDPSGYKTLSGTSMASPHVAGVVAMLLSLNPQLDAYQARDAVLHPLSYDPLVESEQNNAEKSTTGGRLNFYKTLTNYGFITNPILNNWPDVSIMPDVASLEAGESANFITSVSDLDGDTLRTFENFGKIDWAWLLGYQANWHVTNQQATFSSFLAPYVGRTIMYPFSTGARCV